MSRFKKVGGRYGFHSGSGHVKNFEVDSNLWVQGNAIGPMITGNSWYVNKSVNSSGTGDSWDSAFKTITEAVAVAGDYDAIFIAAGFYTEAAEITITQVGLKLIGLNSSGKTRGPCAMKTPTAAGPMLTIAIDANDVEIAGLGFIATSGHEAIVFGAVSTGYVWRSHIHDCAFFGESTGTYAVGVFGATTTPAAGNFPDVAECVVERCYFYDWATAATCVYGTRHMVKDNTIFVPASGVGIVQGNGRPLSEVSGNKILGSNSGDTGILVTGDDDASWICSNNILLNLATLITQDVSDAGISSDNFIYGANGATASVDPTA